MSHYRALSNRGCSFTHLEACGREVWHYVDGINWNVIDGKVEFGVDHRKGGYDTVHPAIYNGLYYTRIESVDWEEFRQGL